MLIFDNETKTIKIVAKDTGDFVFGLDNYELDDGDTVYFTVNDKIEEHPALISLQVNTFTDNKALFGASLVLTISLSLPFNIYISEPILIVEYLCSI